MVDQTNLYLTLPTVVASLLGEARVRNLQLTIIFHPETGRIGETAVIEKSAGAEPSLLGRLSPCFAWGDSTGVPLGDQYVSREALHFRSVSGAVVLSRHASSSRVQVDGSELTGEIRLSNARLARGVAIIIGGRIVLLLRRVGQHGSLASVTAETTVMRGSSAYMQSLRGQISRLANTDLDILIRGETGTGKELVAQAVHAVSDRASAKLIAVNMAAIPVTLAPSVLFGSAKGAFSGADKATLGYFGQADGGTLFLDEIGDTPVEIQTQLLRVLQQREVQCVGGPIRKVNLRVISATDACLDSPSCGFKAALRHRLGESEITLLPLREHPEDIGELLWMFLKKNMASLGRKSMLPGKDSAATEIARWAEVFYRFACYAWPGNIRELENYAHQVAVASETTVSIPEVVLGHLCRSELDDGAGDVPSVKSAGDTRQAITDKAFRLGLENARYEVAKAARQLGISRQSIYRRIAEASDLCLASELTIEQIQAALGSCGGDLAAAAMQLKVSQSALRARLRYLPDALAG